MEVFLRFTLSVTLVIGLVVGVGFCQPQWAESLGLDFWQISDYQQIIEHERHRGQTLDALRAVSEERAQRKETIFQHLLEGKLTLAEAVDQVTELSDEHFLNEDLLYLGLEGNTPRERLAHLMVRWAERRFPQNSASGRQIRQRLERAAREMTQSEVGPVVQ